MRKTMTIAFALLGAALLLGGCASMRRLSRPVDPGVLYFVDAGAEDSEKPLNGYKFGTMNGVLDQVYGKDPLTGNMWGFVNDFSGASYSQDDGTDYMGSVRTDESDTEGKGMTYRFAVPIGTYTVDLAFMDPWDNQKRFMDVLVNGKPVLEKFLPGPDGVEKTFAAEVSNGELDIAFLRSAGNVGKDEDPLVNMIRIRAAQ